MSRWAWITVAAIYGLMSLVTFAYYGLDKRRAGRGGWRIPEQTLHTLEFLGGWPGAMAGQSLFRHKRAKSSYMLVFWLIVFLHLAIWVAIGYLLMR
jgi:uncharacterized membrane protein YsdA (DUF1294 family)